MEFKVFDYVVVIENGKGSHYRMIFNGMFDQVLKLIKDCSPSGYYICSINILGYDK